MIRVFTKLLFTVSVACTVLSFPAEGLTGVALAFAGMAFGGVALFRLKRRKS